VTPNLIQLDQPANQQTDTPSASQSAVTVSHGTSRPLAPAANLTTWSVEDVCHWLSSLGLSKHTGSFRQHDIDGSELQHLTKEVLETEIGVGRLAGSPTPTV